MYPKIDSAAAKEHWQTKGDGARHNGPSTALSLNLRLRTWCHFSAFGFTDDSLLMLPFSDNSFMQVFLRLLPSRAITGDPSKADTLPSIAI